MPAAGGVESPSAMDEATDGALLLAWKSGDVPAFSALVARHRSGLLAHARSLLGRGGPAEDAVQETLLKLAHKPPKLPAEASGPALSGWLHQVLRRECLDTRRGEKRRQRREREAAPDEAVAGGQEQVEATDTKEAVERGLELLSPEQREVIALRLFGEKSYGEIAAITGKKVGTVGWLISEGLARLADELAHLLPGQKSSVGAEVR